MKLFQQLLQMSCLIRQGDINRSSLLALFCLAIFYKPAFAADTCTYILTYLLTTLCTMTNSRSDHISTVADYIDLKSYQRNHPDAQTVPQSASQVDSIKNYINSLYRLTDTAIAALAGGETVWSSLSIIKDATEGLQDSINDLGIDLPGKEEESLAMRLAYHRSKTEDMLRQRREGGLDPTDGWDQTGRLSPQVSPK
jgi:hypothetical protein